MGIPGFQKWLVANFPDTVVTASARVSDTYAHVAFDMNQLCHVAARRATDSETIAQILFSEIDSTLRTCIPTKSILFAFDGPAPLAKLLTQRRRRLKETSKPTKLIPRKPSANSNTNNRKRGNSSHGSPGAPANREIATAVAVDRVAITPGTELMQKIAAAVEYYAYARLQNNHRFQHLQIRISGPDVPGEGELKIFDWLNSFIVARAPSLPATDSLVIVGSDADIVLQALATHSVQNIFVYVNTTPVNNARRFSVISVWKIARHLHFLFPEDSLTVRLDFIVLAIMNGNDYIPKLRGITLSRLWRRYQKLRGRYAFDENNPGVFTSVEGAKFASQTLVDPILRTFNWPFLCALVKNTGARVPEITTESLVASRIQAAQNRALSKERGLTQGDHLKPNDVESAIGRVDNRMTIESVDDVEEQIFYNGLELGTDKEYFVDDRAESDKDPGDDGSNFDEDYSEDVFDEYEDPNSAHITTLISISGSSEKYYDTEQWLRTLLYTLHMYVDGYCPDYEYSYTKPYAPSASALCLYVESHDGDPHPVVRSPISAAHPLTPLKASFAMLPKHAAHLLASPLQELVRDPICYSRIFVSAYSVSMHELHRMVDSIPKQAYSPEELARGAPGHMVLLRRTTIHDRARSANPVVNPPGIHFKEITPEPVIVRMRLKSSSSPPCYIWPRGAIPNMLNRPFKRAHGSGSRGSSRGRTLPRDRHGAHAETSVSPVTDSNNA